MKDKTTIVEDEICSILNNSTSAILSAGEQSRLASLKIELKKMMDHELLSARL